jgi:5'-nucleotidase
LLITPTSSIDKFLMAHYLLTNDDGIDAPGIKALQQAIAAERVTIVAPAEHQSGCGHQVTTQIPIAMTSRSENSYAVTGTPVDCTRVALHHLQIEVDCVLSGINAGGNLGVDAYISGTVAAVREAAILGIPGIAISQYRHSPHPIEWEISTHLTQYVLDRLFSLPLPPRSFWNVNLPHCLTVDTLPELVFCQPSFDPLAIAYQVQGDELVYRGVYRDRPRTPGTDVDVCFSGNIAITQLQV